MANRYERFQQLFDPWMLLERIGKNDVSNLELFAKSIDEETLQLLEAESPKYEQEFQQSKLDEQAAVIESKARMTRLKGLKDSDISNPAKQTAIIKDLLDEVRRQKTA